MRLWRLRLPIHIVHRGDSLRHGTQSGGLISKFIYFRGLYVQVVFGNRQFPHIDALSFLPMLLMVSHVFPM